MTDIVEQLRRMSRMLTYSPEEAAETPEAKAADEIERLRADVAMLRGEITCYEDEASEAEDGFEHDLGQERAENDTLRREIARLNSVIDAYGRHHEDCNMAFPACSCGLRSKWKGQVQ